MFGTMANIDGPAMEFGRSGCVYVLTQNAVCTYGLTDGYAIHSYEFVLDLKMR